MRIYTYTRSLAISCSLLFFSFSTFAQFAFQWDKTIGGSGDDNLTSSISTNDGGYLLAGYSNSPASGDKSEDGNFSMDYWVVKIDGNGNKVWDRTFGAGSATFLRSVSATNDGGYLLAGHTVSNALRDKSEDSKGGDDYWIIKIDGDGNKVWDKTIGGIGTDFLRSITTVDDGGFLLAGYSNSGASGDKSENSRGSYDYWVVKIDETGNKIWDKTFGGNRLDDLQAVTITPDGGFLLGGTSITTASGDQSEDGYGGNDYWIIKIDGNGDKIWDRTYGGNRNEKFYSINVALEGGYILAGYSESNTSGNKSQDSKGNSDYWVIKIDELGNKIWDKAYGGASSDLLFSSTNTLDGGYLLGGYSPSRASGDKSETGIGGRDYWIVRIDGNGNKIWDKIFGGSGNDYLYSTLSTTNGAYLLAGNSDSDASGDKSEDSKGGLDYWVVKLQDVNADNETPVIQEVAPISASTEVGVCDASVAFSAIVTDNSDATITPIFTVMIDGISTEISSPYTFPAGETTVTVNAMDAAGNEATEQTFTVTVEDNEAPLIEEIVPITVTADPGTCTASVDFSAITSDNCDTSVSPVFSILVDGVSTEISSPYTFPAGETTLAVNAMDAAGNEATEQTFTVTVEDNEAPVIDAVVPITAPADAGTCAASVEFSATISDNCDTSVSPVFSILVDGVSTEISSPYTFPAGETTVFVNAMDAAGNEATEQTFTVTVEDNESPVIEAIAPITANA
ncbi:HYR domain-containing protein, partial [Cyclobacterium sp. SYSU L10401]|uniref:HYR domain-containing protein n=1 Tax=Cyclobacterium sp. SYSU L10401 TaxID=2678657 RepID=UPI0013D6FE6C